MDSRLRGNDELRGRPARSDAGRREPDPGSTDVVIQVRPGGVLFLNQLDLPLPVPFLECLLPVEGAFHGAVYFLPDQPVDTITIRESFDQVVLVLPHALDDVGGHSDVQGAAGFVGKDVDARGSHFLCLVPWAPGV